MLRAGVAEAVGTFFLIYTGTATAAGALGKTPPDLHRTRWPSRWRSD